MYLINRFECSNTNDVEYTNITVARSFCEATKGWSSSSLSGTKSNSV